MTPPDPGTILQHDERLRALARAVIGDVDRAEDLVQQAWLAALRRTDPPRSLRAWLSGAVRKLARKQFRGESRRDRREQAAALPEMVPSTAEIVEREAVRRRIVDAVLDLDEPYRGTLLLRFFEGLEPRDVAKRLGVPVETVQTRLKRGLATLRARLESDRPDGRGLLALVPLAVRSRDDGAPLAPVLAKVIAMDVKVKLAACALLAVAGALAFRFLDPDPNPSLPSGGTAEQGLVEPRIGDEPGELGSVLPVAREVAERTEPAKAPAAAARYGSLLVRAVFESDHAPAALVAVRVHCWGDRDPYGNVRVGTTDAAGAVAFDRVPAGTISLGGDRGGRAGGKVAGGEATEVLLSIPAGALVQGVVLDRERRPVASADVFLSDDIGGFEGSIVARSDASGCFAVRDVSSMHYVGARLDGFAPSTLLRVLGSAGETHRIELVLDRAGGAVECEVLAANGEPLPEGSDARIAIDPENVAAGLDSYGHDSLRSIPLFARAIEGGFRFGGVAAGTREIAARARGFAAQRRSVEVREGGTTRVSFRLSPGGRLFGIVRDAAGAAAGGVEVRGESLGGFFSFYSRSDAAGAYSLDGLPVGEEFAVIADGDDRGKARTTLALGSGQESRWDPALARGITIRGRIVDETGMMLPGVSVQADPEEYRSEDVYVPMVETDGDGWFEVPNLREGRWRLSIYLDGAASFPSLVEHHVEAGRRDVLLTVARDRAPSASIVGFVVDPEGKGLAGADVVPAMTGHPTSPILATEPGSGRFECSRLPPGEYRLMIEADGFAKIVTPRFELSPGEQHDLGAIALSAGATIAIRLERAPGAQDAAVDVELQDGELDTGFDLTRDGDVSRSERLMPGRYVARISGKTIACAVRDVVVLVDGGVVDVVVPVAAGITRAVVVRETTPSSSNRMPVEVRDEHGGLLVRSSLWRNDLTAPWSGAFCLAEGRYRLSVLPRLADTDRALTVDLDVGDGAGDALQIDVP